MRPKDVTLALRSLLGSQRPLYIWGPPGVGKSSIVKQAAQELELQVADLRAVLLDPVDLRGLPHINGDGAAAWCPPAFLPREGKGILFLDELAQAPPLVQAGCLQLTLDRKLGEYTLPEGWAVVAASNRQEDRAGAHRLISPLLNRFIHLDMEVSNEDWHAWAVEAGVADEVRSYLHWRPNELFTFDPATSARAFPTPRSWSFVSNVLRLTPAHLLHAVVAGCVGPGPAVGFTAFCQIRNSLPDIEEVLRNPKSATVPDDPEVCWALSGAIVERCRSANMKTLDAAICYAGRFSKKEFRILTARDILAVNSTANLVPSMKPFLRDNRDLLSSTD